MPERTPYIAANWKMHLTRAPAVQLARDVVAQLADVTGAEVVLCPPATALDAVGRVLAGTRVLLGAQTMHWEDHGAYTGEISAPMLVDLGCRAVILGHSERRSYFGERDEEVGRKTRSAVVHDLLPIVCVGESLAEREAGSTLRVVQVQTERALEGVSRELAPGIVVAYEPLWAIGTGKVATTEQAQEVHAFIRGLLSNLHGETVAQRMRILYGGSMKPANAPDLLGQKDIDGGLIGGASLESRSRVTNTAPPFEPRDVSTSALDRALMSYPASAAYAWGRRKRPTRCPGTPPAARQRPAAGGSRAT